jgi:hypothetical protein
VYGVDHGDDVLCRRLGLDVVDGIEDEAAVGREDLASTQDLFADLRWCSEGQHVLCVYASAPEDDAIAELPFELLGLHARGGTLDRVEDVDAGFDERWQEFRNGAAGVLEHLPLRVAVNPVAHLLVLREIEIVECFHRAEGGRLCAEVRAAKEEYVHGFADHGVDTFQILKRDLALTFEYFVDIVLAAAGRDIPFRDVANALGMFEEWRGHQSDVAERSSAEGSSYGSTALSRLLRGAREVVQIFLCDGSEFLGIVSRVQVFFVEGLLTHDGVKEVASAWHPAAGWDCSVAFGVDERAPLTSIVILKSCGTRTSSPLNVHSFQEPTGNPNMVLRAKTPVTSIPIASCRSSSSTASIWNGSWIRTGRLCSP